MPDISLQLQDQILSARHAQQALNIVGGNSKAFMGRTAQGSTLDVSAHSGIVSYQPVELVLTARAGTPLAEIRAALDEQGQMLSSEPPALSAHSTLGGTLACNLSGPARPWAGSLRDHVLGVRLLNGRGEHLRFGGQVMKNVAGYDASRLQAGAMGTLGVITEVSLKVLPKPAFSLTLVEAMDAAQALTVMNQRAALPKPLTAACWLDGKLYSRLAGAQSAVEACVQQWTAGDKSKRLADADKFWQQLRDQQLAFFAQNTDTQNTKPSQDLPLWRFSVKPTAPLPELPGTWLLDWGGAQRWYRGAGTLAEMEIWAHAAGGEASLFRGGDRSGEVFHTPAKPLQHIQQRIKHSFDPDALFNPGRLYRWL